MSTIVKCNRSMSMQLPEGVVCKKGDKIPCPHNCNNKNSRCSGIDSFEVVTLFEANVSSTASVLKYTEAEIKTHWGLSGETEQTSSSDIHGADDENLIENDSVESKYSTRNNRQTETARSSHSGSFNSSHPNSFGDSRQSSFGGSETCHKDKVPRSDDNLKPQKNYDHFELAGKIFTDDVTLKRSMPDFVQPLKNALWEIFTYWETRFVFKSNTESKTELRDEFIWLISTVCAPRSFKKSEVNVILQRENYSISQKFFYLFYDVVYRYDKPKGFYWCDEELTLYRLLARFKDKDDFVAKYCLVNAQGEQFRLFYKSHKEEVLHYIGSENEEKLFEDMTLILSKNKGEVVLIDKFNEYTPIYLGKISSFIANMQQPSNVSKMKDMVKFLENYRVTLYGIISRDATHPFEKSKRNGNIEDACMYKSLELSSSSSYATEFDCFVTLLHEYVNEFKPNDVAVGTLKFTRYNYSDELKKVVMDLCKSHFGQASEDECLKFKSRAWLAKSIYDRKVLQNFVLENEKDIDKIMELVVKPEIDKYISLYHDCVFLINGKDMPVRKYIEEVLVEDVYTICGVFEEDEIINGFFRVKVRDSSKANFNELFDNYQKQYDEFILD